MRSRYKIFGAIILSMVAAQGTIKAQEAGGKIADAKPGDIRILVPNGLRTALEPVRADAESALGHALVIEYDTSNALTAKIENGATFDAAILPQDTMEALASKHSIIADTIVTIGHATVGLAARGDLPAHLDIGSEGGLKMLLLGAKQLRWLGTGPSNPTARKLLTDLGIAEQMNAKISIQNSSQATPQIARPGEYELLMNLTSELRPVDGWRVLGAVPVEFRVPITESAGAGAKGDAGGAKAFLSFLQGPTFGTSLIASGMTR